jgi:hypothetical protein
MAVAGVRELGGVTGFGAEPDRPPRPGFGPLTAPASASKGGRRLLRKSRITRRGFAAGSLSRVAAIPTAFFLNLLFGFFHRACRGESSGNGFEKPGNLASRGQNSSIKLSRHAAADNL